MKAIKTKTGMRDKLKEEKRGKGNTDEGKPVKADAGTKAVQESQRGRLTKAETIQAGRLFIFDETMRASD